VELPDLSDAEAPIVHLAEVGTALVDWRDHQGLKIRRVFNPRGGFADLKDLEAAKPDQLVFDGLSNVWWSDHPCSEDRSLLSEQDPYRSPLFDDGSLSGVLRRNRVVSTTAAEIELHGKILGCAVIGGALYRPAFLPGWVVLLDLGQATVRQWVPGVRQTERGETYYFPGSHSDPAIHFANRVGQHQFRRTGRNSSATSADLGAASLETLNAAIHRVRGALFRVLFRNIDPALLGVYAACVQTVVARSVLAVEDDIRNLTLACEQSKLGKLQAIGANLHAWSECMRDYDILLTEEEQLDIDAIALSDD
jgi:hypothetical protein